MIGWDLFLFAAIFLERLTLANIKPIFFISFFFSLFDFPVLTSIDSLGEG